MTKLLKRMTTAWSRHHRSAGFGIHSPHAFRFVTEVLGERRHYYAYDDIAALRHWVIAALGSSWPHREVISNRNARLLLRVVNRFNPSCFMQVGTTTGLTSAVLLAVSSASRLWLHEPRLAQLPVAAQVLQPLGERVMTHAELRSLIDRYRAALDGAMPFVLVNHIHSDADAALLCQEFPPMLTGRMVLVVRHLAVDPRVRTLWRTCCQQLAAGQTFTNDRIGILVADPKLQREHFDLWF